MMKRLWQWLLKNEGLVLILLLVVILRLPSLFEPYWYGDEGIYLVLGQALKKGLVWYRDIHDNKPPLLYLIAAVAGNVFYFRMILLFWFLATTGLFFRLMQHLFPNKRPAWYLSTLALVGLTTLFEGNVANAEIFMILPLIAAMMLVWEKKRFFLAGLLFALGFLFKVPAGMELAAALIWLIVWERVRLKQGLILLSSFCFVVVATIVYYGLQGAFEPYVRSALLQNIGYLSSWQTGEHSASGFTSQTGLIKRVLLIIVALTWFYPISKKFKLSRAASLTVIWFLLALFGALLSERPYPHYLIQAAVPAAILISFFIFGRRKILKLIILTAGLIAGLWYYQIRFWSYPILPYYRNFVSWATGKISVEQYRNFFDSRVNQTYRVADYLKEKTLAGRPIFVWGDEPYLYALSQRLPVGRYTATYHVVDFNGYQETLAAWEKQPPAVVVVMSYETRRFPEMEEILAADYVLAKEIDRALIYRRLEH